MHVDCSGDDSCYTAEINDKIHFATDMTREGQLIVTCSGDRSCDGAKISM